ISNVLHFFGHRKKSWMPVDLVIGWLEQQLLLPGRACRDVCRLDDPDAEAFVTPRIHVARVLDGHPGVRSMQAADMLVGEPMLAANEDFPQRPLVSSHERGSISSIPPRRAKGKFGFASSDSLRFPRWLLLRIRERCLSDPRALLPRL